MSTELEALEAAVVSAPSSLEARAALRDRLNELGDPRGEHMALSLELDQLHVWEDRFHEVKRRVAELEAEHSRTWLAEIAQATRQEAGRPWGNTRFFFRRGALERLEGDIQDLAHQLSATTELAPVVELVELDNVTTQPIERLAETPALKRVRKLTLRTGSRVMWKDPLISPLLESPHLERLDKLTINLSRTSTKIKWDDEVRRLTECPALAGLEELGLLDHAGKITPAGVETLMAAPFMSNLRKLGLKIGEEERLFQAVAQLRGLEELSLGGVNARGLDAISDLACKDTLLSLSLRESSETPNHPITLTLPELRALSVTGFGLDEAKMMQLLDDSNLGKLRVLTLSAGREDGVVKALAKRWRWGSLRELNLLGVESAEALAALLASPIASELKRLGLAGLGTAAWDALLAWPGLAQLEALDVRHLGSTDDSPLTPRRAHTLFDALAAVHELDLRGQLQGADPIRSLARANGLTKLRRLSILTGDPSGIVRLAHSRVGAQLEALRLPTKRLELETAEALAQMPHLARLQFPTGYFDAPFACLVERFGPGFLSGNPEVPVENAFD
ncbi:MAG: hypothetical protein KC492_36665 [Myxococcales bacterium]|nr:hypothetical protein [Myxococcales bacterium]